MRERVKRPVNERDRACTRSLCFCRLRPLGLLQRSLVLVQPPGVVERVDCAAVALVGQVVLDRRPGQRELRRQTRRCHRVLLLAEVLLQVAKDCGLLLGVELGLRLIDQVVDLGVAGAVAGALVAEDRAGRLRRPSSSSARRSSRPESGELTAPSVTTTPSCWPRLVT